MSSNAKASALVDLLRWCVRLPSRAAILVVRIYQWTLSPMLGPACRFSPSCSHYACGCLSEHGLVRGSWLTVRRLGRCHPWHPGGYDPVPPAASSRALPARTEGAAQ